MTSIVRGSTFVLTVQWAVPPIIYKPITGITQTAPVRITCVGHGLVDGWPVAITNVKGMTDINATANKISDRDKYPVTVIDADTFEINTIDAAGFKAYTSGGYVQYDTPQTLTSITPRMTIRDRVGGTVLASTEIGDAPLNVIAPDADNATKIITFTIDADDTADFAWKKGVFDVEGEALDGTVTQIWPPTPITVTDEITT